MSKIMAVNAGSSSLKFQLLQMPEDVVITEGQFEKIGLKDPVFTIEYQGEKNKKIVDIENHADCVEMLLNTLLEMKIVNNLEEISGVGHRVLHCGEKFSDSVVLDDYAIEVIESVCDLGPLHNPANLIGIRAFQKALPNVVQVAVFDTSFHLTMPDESFMYALPYEWYTKHGVRKYGFHGTSHKYVSKKAAEFLGQPIENLRIVTAHLGNGASLAAIKNGKVVDTTMGLTPLEGLPMGTRSGNFDPAIIEFICKKEKLTVEEVNTILNKKSGYIGFYPKSSDAREVRAAAAAGDYRADLILRMQAKKVTDFIGSYFVYMGGIDTIVFTAGIGEKSPETRWEICRRLKEALGVEIDEEKNKIKGELMEISTPNSKIKVLVVPTNEELMIARDVIRLGNIEEK